MTHGNSPTSQSGPSAALAKSPFAEAASLHRDKRREIIQEIQKQTGRMLLCYVAAPEASIGEEDVRYLQELISPLERGVSIDLLMHSDGGDFCTAEKMVLMLWGVMDPADTTIPAGELRVVVPERAKSAATFLTLGADSILMSNTSELGPIDPQIPLPDRDGNINWHSVFDYLDAYESAEQCLRERPEDPVTQAVFKRFEPVVRQALRQAKTHVRVRAENLLKKRGGNYTLAPSQLMNTKKFPSHSQVIDWETAKNDIGLNVEFMDSGNALWQLYWRLYCYLRLVSCVRSCCAVEGSCLPVDASRSPMVYCERTCDSGH